MNRLGRTALAALLAIAIATPAALAQAQPADAASGPVAIDVNQVSTLSDAEKISQTEDYIDEMKKVLKRALSLLEEARSEKDVVKLNCVNEKLTAIKGLLRISEQAHVALQEAVAKRERAQAEHEFTKISIAYQKVLTLRGEAEACIGEQAVYAGSTQVDVEMTEEMAEQDPTIVRDPQLLADERPPAASPLQ